jgi:4-hydroxybenzoate polyprenyltransferase
LTHGIKSTAILFGARGPAFYLGVALGAVLFAYQQWRIREREPQRCFEGFPDNNRFGMVVFAGLLADYFVTP